MNTMNALLRRLPAVSLLLLCAATAAAQQAPLNPTVTVLPRAASPVPPQCEDGPAPPVTRPVPTPAPAPPPAPLPQPPAVEVPEPAADVRSLLRAAWQAGRARDRAAFQAALARARNTAGATQADRNVLTVLEDVNRLWEYQINTPAGSFFDASVQGGSLLQSLTRYPGYERFIAPHLITDSSGTRYYPTRESMDFLLGIAGERLGGEAARRRPDQTIAVPAPAPASPAPAPAPVVRRERQPSSTAARQPAAAKSPRPTRRSRPASSAASRPAPAPVSAAPVEEPPMPPGVVATEPAPPPTATTAPPMMESGTAASGTAVEEPAVPSPATATAGEIAAPAVDPEEQEGESSGRRSLIMPLVLILIGVGVLILLFRASS